MNSLFAIATALWLFAAALAICRCLPSVARVALIVGCAVSALGALLALLYGAPPTILPGGLFGQNVIFRITAEAAWLLGLGSAAAAVACIASQTLPGPRHVWTFGAAMAFVGATGVFGIQDGAAFLIAWEVMSFGGALMIFGERRSQSYGEASLFMLALLEVGSVALLLAVIALASQAGVLDFGSVPSQGFSKTGAIAIGVLLLAGFGAKLGILPFFEWFPNAYRSVSGVSGALLSGIVLNAAFFGLGRGLIDWLPYTDSEVQTALGLTAVIAGVASAVLTALYALQEDDWRSLLSFSSAENASIAVTMLGACLLFRGDSKPELAGLAWTVALLHLGGHCLAKSGLFIAADSVHRATGTYLISQNGLLRRSGKLFGLGTLFAAMSLAAMPPQAGFVSEWFVFQTVFQGFHLSGLGGRLTMALAGAGLALTAAVALATFVKVFGVGLLGTASQKPESAVPATSWSVGILGISVLAFSVGLPAYLNVLAPASTSHFGADATALMVDGVLLVPLTSKFAFISPTLLVLAMPLLALIPILLVALSGRRPVRRAPVWYGGLRHEPNRVSTTSLTFSNAMRTFYSFIYRPVASTEREAVGSRYFVHNLKFTHEVAPIFGPLLFRPATRIVSSLARWFRRLQSGSLNFYLSMIGLLLVLILGIALA